MMKTQLNEAQIILLRGLIEKRCAAQTTILTAKRQKYLKILQALQSENREEIEEFLMTQPVSKGPIIRRHELADPEFRGLLAELIDGFLALNKLKYTLRLIERYGDYFTDKQIVKLVETAEPQSVAEYFYRQNLRRNAAWSNDVKLAVIKKGYVNELFDILFANDIDVKKELCLI